MEEQQPLNRIYSYEDKHEKELHGISLSRMQKMVLSDLHKQKTQ